MRRGRECETRREWIKPVRALDSSLSFPPEVHVKFVDDMPGLTLKRLLLQSLIVISMAALIGSRHNRAKYNNNIDSNFPGSVKNATEPSRRRAEVAQHRKLPPESSLPEPDVVSYVLSILVMIFDGGASFNSFDIIHS